MKKIYIYIYIYIYIQKIYIIYIYIYIYIYINIYEKDITKRQNSLLLRVSCSRTHQTVFNEE